MSASTCESTLIHDIYHLRSRFGGSIKLGKNIYQSLKLPFFLRMAPQTTNA
jgi:hypothetical protein